MTKFLRCVEPEVRGKYAVVSVHGDGKRARVPVAFQVSMQLQGDSLAGKTTAACTDALARFQLFELESGGVEFR
eukprot:4061574-Amphidinium_carterae.1